MPGTDPEVHEEVAEWLGGLNDRDRARAAALIDLLVERGPLLGEPHTRQLAGKLRELRLQLGGKHHRITYWIKPGGTIALLTVFRKTRQRERREIDRAVRERARCEHGEH